MFFIEIEHLSSLKGDTQQVVYLNISGKHINLLTHNDMKIIIGSFNKEIFIDDIQANIASR